MLFSFTSHRASSRTRAHTDCTTRLTQGLLAALVALVGFNAGAQSLPPEVDALLARAKVPREAFAAVVVDAAPALTGKAMPLLAHPMRFDGERAVSDQPPPTLDEHGDAIRAALARGDGWPAP